MKKDQYFPHEVNLRQTSEFINLIENEGITGYGIYWGLIEYLRSQDNYTGDLRVLKSLTRQMKTKLCKVESVLRNYQLFELTEFTFTSVKLKEVMVPLEKKRNAIRMKTESKTDANRVQTESKSEANRMQTENKTEANRKQMPRNSLEINTTLVAEKNSKVKKSKVKESKKETSSAEEAKKAEAAAEAIVPVRLPWEEYVDELDKEQQWKEIMAMRSGLKKEFYNLYPRIVERFKEHVRAIGKERTILSTSDAKHYFCFFLSPGSITYKHLMAQLGTSPEKNNPYRFEERDPANGQRSYCGVPIPDDAPPRPNAQAAWNSQLKRWVF